MRTPRAHHLGTPRATCTPSFRLAGFRDLVDDARGRLMGSARPSPFAGLSENAISTSPIRAFLWNSHNSPAILSGDDEVLPARLVDRSQDPHAKPGTPFLRWPKAHHASSTNSSDASNSLSKSEVDTCQVDLFYLLCFVIGEVVGLWSARCGEGGCVKARHG